MPSFNLNIETTERLRSRFKLFEADREKVRGLLDGYVADYRAFSGTALARGEYLRDKYKSLAPNLTHLVYDEDGEIYWNAADISIILGRDATSVTRAFREIEKTPYWRTRLYQLRKTVDSRRAPPVYAYKKEIFDFLIDFYEEEYLQRFIAPRRGEAMTEEETAEIYRFWEYLRAESRAGGADGKFPAEAGLSGGGALPLSLPKIPPMSLKEVLRLIIDRLFTVKMGAFFTLLLAFGYELPRRWSGFYLLLPVLSVGVFVSCVLLIRRRRFDPGRLSNAGASALLLCCLWLVGLASRADYTLENHNMVLNPSARDGAFFFNISAENIGSVKEFFYRIKPDEEYRSTGFMQEINPGTELPYPNVSIPKENIQYVSAQLFFKDGTSSDVRISRISKPRR